MIENKNSGFYYGYIIVAASFLIQVLMWGAFLTFGVFFNPMSTEFGWARAITSGPRSLCFFLMGLFSIIAGRLNDRFGPRLVATLTCLFLGFGYLLMSQVTAVWQFFLFYGVMAGIGMSGPDVALLSTVARWFVNKRGMMSGIIKVGAGAGMLTMPLLANWLISTYGWRTSYTVIGLVILVGSILAAQFLRRDPSKMGLLPNGDKVEKEDKELQAVGFSVEQAIHTRPFWLLCAMFFLFNFCTLTVITHLFPHAVDLGMSEAIGANLLSAIGGASMVGRFMMGIAGDRIGNKPSMIIDLIILAVASFLLIAAKEVWMLYVFAILYGFAHGGLFTLISPIIAELFGLSSHGAIFGAITFGGCTGGTIGPVLVGYIFDVTGSYRLGFICLIIASIVATLLVINIKIKPKDISTL